MRATTLVLLALTAGCASTYTLSPEMQAKSHAMSDAEAEQNIARYLVPSDKAGGLCVTSGKVARPAGGFGTQAMLDGSNLHYKATVITGAHVSESHTANFGREYVTSTKVTYDLGTGDFIVNLKDVENIRLTDSLNLPACLQQAGRGKVISMKVDLITLVQINIPEKNAPEVMASMIHLAPNAKRLTGVGL